MGDNTWTGKKYMGVSGYRLSKLIGAASGAGFLLFGYDQGVMGSLLTLRVFIKQFPRIDSSQGTPLHNSVLQGAVIGIYEVGCLMGALSCMWIGDRLGRRKVIYLGVVWMVIGTILQTTSYGITQLAIARVVTGFGNGMNTATIPTWQSECSPAHMRGKLIMVEGALITGGIMCSYWIDFAFYWIEAKNASHIDAAWRVPIVLQLLLCIPTISFTAFLPDSPRWLMLKGREEEARTVLSALEEADPYSPTVTLQINEMKESLALVQQTGVKDMFTNGPTRNFHRMCLGVIVQCFQQVGGCNLVIYYAGVIFQNGIGLSDMVSRIVTACNGTEYFAASWVAVYLVERMGRRWLMLVGAMGMATSMMVLAITNAPAITKPVQKPGAPLGVTKNTNTGASIAATVFVFVFNTFFALGWLGMTWLLPAELTPLPVRAASNGIATASNWLFNFIIVLVSPISFAQIKYKTYIVFCIINLFIFTVTYLIVPETAGRSLEEMDDIFASSSKKDWTDVVRVERRTPRWYDASGNHLKTDVETPIEAQQAVQLPQRESADMLKDEKDDDKKSAEIKVETTAA